MDRIEWSLYSLVAGNRDSLKPLDYEGQDAVLYYQGESASLRLTLTAEVGEAIFRSLDDALDDCARCGGPGWAEVGRSCADHGFTHHDCESFCVADCYADYEHPSER